MSIGTHIDLPAEVQAAIQNAIAVVDAHMAGLNARNPKAIAAGLHFPHYRLAGSVFKVWQTPDTYLDDFFARAGKGWARSQWNRQDVIAAGVDPFGLNQGAVEGLQVERAVQVNALATRTPVRPAQIATFFEVAQCAGATIYVCTNPLNISSKYSSARACNSAGVRSWIGCGTNT
tara:strand:+ start:480 stop:1004 length:525 start_codon:yes stop_codon:yes gene_type:complete